MTAPDQNKEITLTISELDALIKAAGSRALLEHVQDQAKAAEVSKKIQAQLAPSKEA